jgi:hypothetical protein
MIVILFEKEKKRKKTSVNTAIILFIFLLLHTSSKEKYLNANSTISSFDNRECVTFRLLSICLLFLHFLFGFFFRQEQTLLVAIFDHAGKVGYLTSVECILF